ncbi:MAG TPA: U32 family peptidase [Terriglobales bacterium]|nr:U32 family peptidase [Terriglobales bacterium]
MTPQSALDRPVELLAPARDLECGLAAINCGADAVYIGAPRFGARAAAGNTTDDIAALVESAHRYWARVYVTLNTLLRDDEVPEAVDLAWRLHALGIDGLIIQDMGLLECDLPPLPLIASTQTHNYTADRVAFLEKVGFCRAILARELSLAEIKAIRSAAPKIELECFVHGALCVCYSGQCYLSYAIGGRSGNRGECAQPCRKRYDLVDAEGKTLVQGRHLLSVRDLNLSEHLGELLDAGVTSFKVEGRLKDARFVSNVVAHYSARLDELGVNRVSSGRSRIEFAPDVTKTFNRGFTTYFFQGRCGSIGSHFTPKMVGEHLGRVRALRGNAFALDSSSVVHPGDGLCFFGADGELTGTLVNSIENGFITPAKVEGLCAGADVYRNHDHQFMAQIDQSRNARRIEVGFTVRSNAEIETRDEDGNAATIFLGEAQPANNRDAAAATLQRQLRKTGDTEFAATRVEVEADPVPFVPVSAINGARRELLEQLRRVRSVNRPRLPAWKKTCGAVFPQQRLGYSGNVLNDDAAAFYRRHGVTDIEPAAESGLDMRGRVVMTTRYCLKFELGVCPKQNAGQRHSEPLTLADGQGTRLRLRFDCVRCEMQVLFE